MDCFTFSLSRIWEEQFSLKRIQGDAGGKINILGRHSNGRCEKEVHMNMCIILICYRDRAACIGLLNLCRFLVVGLDEERSLQKKVADARRISHSHFGCCYPHKQTRGSSQTNNTRFFSPTSCKMPWRWLWDFRPITMKCNKFFHFCAANFSLKH